MKIAAKFIILIIMMIYSGEQLYANKTVQDQDSSAENISGFVIVEMKNGKALFYLDENYDGKIDVQLVFTLESKEDLNKNIRLPGDGSFVSISGTRKRDSDKKNPDHFFVDKIFDEHWTKYHPNY